MSCHTPFFGQLSFPSAPSKIPTKSLSLQQLSSCKSSRACRETPVVLSCLLSISFGAMHAVPQHNPPQKY